MADISLLIKKLWHRYMWVMFILLLFYSKSWRVYGRNAEGVREALAASHPDLQVVLNPQKPRRNSFEVTLMEGDKGKAARQYPYMSLFWCHWVTKLNSTIYGLSKELFTYATSVFLSPEQRLFCGLALRRVLHANWSFPILLKWCLLWKKRWRASRGYKETGEQMHFFAINLFLIYYSFCKWQ